MERDYVWEGTYGDRTSVKIALKEILKEQDASSLQMLAAFVNNNPYNLEFFIAVSYDLPQKNHVDNMIELLEDQGLTQRKDLTLDQMISEMGNRRFNSCTFLDEYSIDLQFESLFFFPEVSQLEKKGYYMIPFGKKQQVFISHASVDKKEVEKIIPYLNAQNLPVWFDKYSISAGMSITNSVQEGIEDSNIAIFWITESFLASRWCKTEMTAFIKKLIEENCLILTVLDDEVDVSRLPLFLRDIKYIQKNKRSVFKIAEEIVKSLKIYKNNK